MKAGFAAVASAGFASLDSFGSALLLKAMMPGNPVSTWEDNKFQVKEGQVKCFSPTDKKFSGLVAPGINTCVGIKLELSNGMICLAHEVLKFTFTDIQKNEELTLTATKLQDAITTAAKGSPADDLSAISIETCSVVGDWAGHFGDQMKDECSMFFYSEKVKELGSSCSNKSSNKCIKEAMFQLMCGDVWNKSDVLPKTMVARNPFPDFPKLTITDKNTGQPQEKEVQTFDWRVLPGQKIKNEFVLVRGDVKKVFGKDYGDL